MKTNDALTKKVRAAIVKHKGDHFELVYSYHQKTWHARLYRHRYDEAAVAAELERQGLSGSVSLAQMDAARRTIQERPVAVGEGETAEAAVGAIKGA